MPRLRLHFSTGSWWWMWAAESKRGTGMIQVLGIRCPDAGELDAERLSVSPWPCCMVKQPPEASKFCLVWLPLESVLVLHSLGKYLSQSSPFNVNLVENLGRFQQSNGEKATCCHSKFVYGWTFPMRSQTRWYKKKVCLFVWCTLHFSRHPRCLCEQQCFLPKTEVTMQSFGIRSGHHC